MEKSEFVALIKKHLNFESLEHSIESDGKFLVSKLDSSDVWVINTLQKMFYDNKDRLANWNVNITSTSLGFTSFKVSEVIK